MTYQATVVDKPAGRDRIIVGGYDITYLRGKRTPTPSYTLTQPLGYGSARVVLPHVSFVHEADDFGTGELSFIKTGARVLVQRVNDAGVVTATDYRGIVMSVGGGAGGVVLEVGGVLAGPASVRSKQIPVYRGIRDIGRMAYDAVEHSGNFPGVHFTPVNGTDIGIKIANQGGMSHLDWLLHLCNYSQRRNGAQHTLMPVTPGSGTFEFRAKNTSTKHCTIYLDRSRAVPDLRDDAAEKFNTGFGTGVTRDGMIIDGTVLPGIEDAPAPDYPKAGGASFGIGTTNADTLDGSGLSTLHWKLTQSGLLDRDDVDYNDEGGAVYDDDTADAVRDLQQRAGLAVTGVVNVATWEALFDVSASAWSITQARILPMVQDPRVRSYNVTANGSFAGKNPDYDLSALRVDRDFDFGAGVTERFMRNYMAGQMERYNRKTWTGTITLNGVGAIVGEHNPGDPTPTAADVLSMRDIQPGWNAWLPNFDGGTLVHITEVTYNPGTAGSPDSLTLTVDTHYRDALEIREVLARNADSRRSPRREWLHTQRSSRKINDSVTPFNAKAGLIYRRWTLPGHQWTVIPLFAGQSGDLSKLRIALATPAEFCCAIFASQIGSGKLQRRVGNPFPVNGDDESVWDDPDLDDWFENRTLMYAAGDEKQPLGYGRRRHFKANGDATSAPLTGVWEDNASFHYVTGDIPALWLAIYPDRDTALKRGRALWAAIGAAT